MYLRIIRAKKLLNSDCLTEVPEIGLSAIVCYPVLTWFAANLARSSFVI